MGAGFCSIALLPDRVLQIGWDCNPTRNRISGFEIPNVLLRASSEGTLDQKMASTMVTTGVGLARRQSQCVVFISRYLLVRRCGVLERILYRDIAMRVVGRTGN
jgi:hypothetical protein